MSRWVIDTPHGQLGLGADALAPGDGGGEREADGGRDTWFFVQCRLRCQDGEAIAGALELYREVEGLPFCRPGELGCERARQLADWLEAAAATGWIQLDRVRGGGEPVSAGPRKKAAAAASPGDEKESRDDLIEVLLVDEAGAPVANERYELRMPDGQIVRGVTDASGKAWSPRTSPGTGELTFPNLDEEAWEAA